MNKKEICNLLIKKDDIGFWIWELPDGKLITESQELKRGDIELKHKKLVFANASKYVFGTGTI